MNFRPGSGRPKCVKTTDNIAIVQELICSQDDEVMRHGLYGAPIVDRDVTKLVKIRIRRMRILTFKIRRMRMRKPIVAFIKWEVGM